MNELLRKIPKIDTLLNNKKFIKYNKELLSKIVKRHINNLRDQILSKKIDLINEKQIIKEIEEEYLLADQPSLKPLINATGVIIHTNMGRSLISKESLQNACETICGYSNLEYNLTEGKRGQRYDHITKELQNLLGVESALVVNNNASAVFLVLNTFAKNKEVIVSRGELVEIGGSFRIPEVMRHSGAILKEIGTTNKTKLKDYEEAINDNTAIIMKIHKSNFDIVGFSEDVAFEELIKLSNAKGILDYYDLGSGYIPELPYGLTQKEPPLAKILKHNPSLISFSGDKLFGSVQAGIIMGKKEYIDKLKKNQLLRMLRVDKITLSLLQESIRAYLNKEYEKIPTLKMLYTTTDTLKKRANNLRKKIGIDRCEVVETKTYVGGGTMPNRAIPSIAIAFFGDAKELEKSFRQNLVIGRIESDRFLLDLRSVQDELDEKVANIALKIVK